jgi:protein-disulfide isomerase
MKEPRADASAAKDDSGSANDGVVLRIPRRSPAVSRALIVLLVLGSVLGWGVYRWMNRGDRPSGPVEARRLLPPPVTFIPPTPKQAADTARFQVSPDDDPTVGPVDAPVLIIEFSDFQCQFCGIFARETLHPLLELYKDQIRFVYRDLVIYGPMSLQAAVAAECANDQGAFWPYHDRLFEQQNRLTPDFFLAMVNELNLDTQQFARCISDPAVEDEVKADTAEGQALGIRGTPTFYINGRILVGAQPLTAFAAVIDDELALVAAETPGSALQDTPHDP